MERKIGKEIREIQRLLHQKIEVTKDDRNEKLTHVQVHLLLYIHRQNQPIFQKDIEQYLKIRRSSATQMLNVLERESFIKRLPNKADRRMKEIKITKKTLALIDKMNEHMHNIEQMLQENISDKDLETFFNVVDQIKANLE
ncbi:MAG TPA: MarR family transcriptional regulator [Erysipelothrix sp.]|nr:MarR family transcriptional regulator [Erysipelothrix sp.]